MKVTIIEGTASEVQKILSTIGSSQEDMATQEAEKLAEKFSNASDSTVITIARN